MRKSICFLGIIILFLIFAIKLPVDSFEIEKSQFVLSNGKFLYVGGTGSGNYSTIKDALDDASDGDTVFVFNESSPYEECIEIHDKISLIGEDKYSTIIIGDCLEKIITIYDRQVTISGFTIKTNDSKKYPYYGIYIQREETTIKDNIFSNIETGISVISSNNQIVDNQFVDCGIFIGPSNNENTISNNYVNGKPLIYRKNKFNEKISDAGQVILENCINITIENSDISNAYYGIFLCNSRFCKLKGNKLNNSNIFLMDSSDNEILDNKICFVERRTMYQTIGINLLSSDENIITGNNISSIQGYGLQIYISNENMISGNNIIDNQLAIRLDDSNSNNIKNNNFIGNFRKISFIDCKKNIWDANFWCRFRFLPKLIKGSITIVPPTFGSPGKYLPWFNIDWHPAKEPYDM